MPSVGNRAQMFLSQFRPQAPSPSGLEMYQKYISDQANNEFERDSAFQKRPWGPEPTFYAPQPSGIDAYQTLNELYPALKDAAAESTQRNLQAPYLNRW